MEKRQENDDDGHQQGSLTKDMHGRTFSNLGDNYVLPSSTKDQEESNRLNRQGLGIKIAMGLYFCPDIVERLLHPAEGASSKILDVGCGTGMWAIDMARRFPHVSVLGVDLAPHSPGLEAYPPNVRFEVHDINLGMAKFHNQFDMIQMRCVVGGINDMGKTLSELFLSLKPGGFLTIIDGDYLLDENGTQFIKIVKLPGDDVMEGASDAGSWVQRTLYETITAAVLNGIDGERSHNYLNYGIWDQPLCDPETVKAGSFLLPVGPWRTDPDPSKTRRLHATGILMQSSLLDLHLAWHPFLRKCGVEKETLEEWGRKADQELRSLTPKMWWRYGFCFARKRAGEGLPAPPLPIPHGFSLLPSPLLDLSIPPGYENIDIKAEDLALDYPAMEIFDTRAQAFAAAERRSASIRERPASVVAKAWGKKKKNGD
ncbi:S-adenosyl-L-methionine-dependent methyltransferase [Serendipita vermifera]|nr:S-adenosyl-L-methionine-dependent methyltransferase [Serendipita vermifera]